MTGGDGATTEAVPCMACGRLLRDEESRRLRIGPHCLKRLQARLAPRPRIVGTRTAEPHPAAVPARITTQLELELWDGEDVVGLFHSRPTITEVPTGALL